jgi:TrkA domain protein
LGGSCFVPLDCSLEPMPVELRETRLPGIGVKYGFRTGGGSRLAIILHNDGQREIYYYRRPDDDEPAAVIHLHDDEARQLGAVIGGAYERPKIVEDLEMALGELAIEWVPVPDGSPAIGHTLAECGFRARTGVTVIAILREPEPISGAQPHDVIEQGDTLVTVGKARSYAAFRRLLAEGPVESSPPAQS